MTAVRVQVTQQDIDNGRMHNVLCCPVALATRRALGRQVVVYPYSFRLTGQDRWLKLPDQVAHFIDNFDSDWPPVEPFEFDLDVPDDLLAGAS